MSTEATAPTVASSLAFHRLLEMLSHEAVAGLTAGACSSTLLHPFDYIKVKLQGICLHLCN